MNFSRAQLQDALRRLFVPADQAAYANELGELVQPTLNLLDLLDTPYMRDFGYPVGRGTVTVAAVAAEFPGCFFGPQIGFALVLKELWVRNDNAAAQELTLRMLRPADLATWGLTELTGGMRQMAAADSTLVVTAGRVVQGTHTAAPGPSYGARNLAAGAETVITLPVPWIVHGLDASQLPVIGLSGGTVNQTLTVTGAFGRIFPIVP